MGVTGGDAPAPVVAPILRELSVSPFLQGVLFGISAGLLLLGSFILRPFSFVSLCVWEIWGWSCRMHRWHAGWVLGRKGCHQEGWKQGLCKELAFIYESSTHKKKAVLGQPKPCFPYETPLACFVETCCFWAFPPYFYARFYFSWLLEASYFSPPFKRKLQVGRRGRFGA